MGSDAGSWCFEYLASTMNAHDLKDELLAVAALLKSRESFFPDEEKCIAQQKEEALVENLAHKIQTSLVRSLTEATSLYESQAQG